MIRSFNKREWLLLALAGTLALAACDNTDDNGGNNGGANQNVTLAAVVNSVITTQTSDTAVPLEINALNIDTNADDLALPNSDSNYGSLVGT